MATIAKLFDEITIIRPEKIGILGEDGLQSELNTKVELLAKKIWDSLPLKDNFSMPSTDYCSLPPTYCCEDILDVYLESMNESVKNVSKLFNEIQARTKVARTKIKKSSKMPSALKNIRANYGNSILEEFDDETGKSNIEEACNAMRVPVSAENLIDYGETLLSSYLSATSMIEIYIKNIAKMVMTENEIRELTDYNEFKNVYLPSLYKDDDKLIEVCNRLIRECYLDGSTLTDDFVYFFSGRGKAPKQNLIWIGNNVELAFFLDSYFTKFKNDIPEKWKIAHKIFNRKNLRQSLKNSENSTDESLNQMRYDTFNAILEMV